jgi:D-alanyl-lipoteichoic acid acyltransferase DltB (MBOAT superfamily)
VRFFVHPFTAASFAEFWRRWNPVYGYFLAYYVYRPSARHLPRPAAVMATFLFAGLILHDLPAWLVTRRILPPGGAIAFTLFGAGLVASQHAGMNMSTRPTAVRVAVNVTYIVTCTGLMLVIARRLARP